MSAPGGDRAGSAAGEGVADAMWARVRLLAARAERLERAAALDELDDEGRARLAALRLRCARAAERARLADDLADRVAEAAASRRRRPPRGAARP